MPSQLLRAFDRIVIGQREQIHLTPLQRLENLFRIAVTFAAKALTNRVVQGPEKYEWTCMSHFMISTINPQHYSQMTFQRTFCKCLNTKAFN